MKENQKAAFSYAFPKTVPVLVGYLFLGAAYGILMKVNGYGWGWILAMSVFVYAGSLQFVGVQLLGAATNPLYAFLLALMINARHLFYGLSMLGSYQSLKAFRPYLIFALTDETFSVLCHEEVPKELSKEWVYLWIALLNQGYWIAGSILGWVIGQAVSFNTKGLDFALTALFIVIFLDQWKEQPKHASALLGIGASVLAIVVTGTNYFIIPAMAAIIIVLSLQYRREGSL